MSETNTFARLASIDLSDRVEKKAGLSYVSWVWAVDRLLREDPNATWEYRFFGELPYLLLPDGTAMVFCTVTAFGQSRTMQLPVMSGRNQPVSNPDSFAVNTAMQRALAKAIALFGIAFHVYCGEDLPVGEASNDPVVDEQPAPPKPKAPVTPLPGEGRISQAQMKYLESLIAKTDTDVQRLCDYFHVGSLGELTVAAASRAIKSLESKRRAA